MRLSIKHVRYAVVVCVAAGLGIAAGTIVHGRSQKDAVGANEIKIDNFTFAPGTVTVTRGTTVEWLNRDDIPHTVVSEDKTTFKSKALDTDDKFSNTFTKPGSYSYFCSIHPKMTGKIVVQ
jgi:plastocyanin